MKKDYKALAEAYVRSQRPALMQLSFGCKVEKIYWYKSETHKKNNQPDWMYSREGGDYGVVVKDLRNDFLPMWIDKGDQLEFQIQPNDIVSMEIIGHRPQLQDWLAVLGKHTMFGIPKISGSANFISLPIYRGNKYSGDVFLEIRFNLTTGQPNSPEDYKAFNNITGV